jgi:hypothetical protein
MILCLLPETDCAVEETYLAANKNVTSVIKDTELCSGPASR